MVDKSMIPQYRVHSILDITPADLIKIGIKVAAIDADNTIVYDNTLKYIPKIEEWIKNMKSEGIEVVIVSNASFLRAWRMSKKLDITAYGMCFKPSPRGLIRAAKKYNVNITEVAMIGDQLLSDVRAASSCGAVAIKTDLIEKEIRFARSYEKCRAREKDTMEVINKTKGYGFDA